MANTWTNSDGLKVRFGTAEPNSAYGGEVAPSGIFKVVEFDVDLTDLTDIASTVTYLSDTYIIPAGAIVEQVDVVVIEASAGTNSNFDLGFRKASDRTAYDDDGLLIAADGWHTSAQGTTTIYRQGDTDHGAVLGIVLTNDSYIVASYDTAAFTDGVIKIRIYWYTPRVTA